MKVRAYAKINLGLHVLGKRSDGYHSIETVFRVINLYDELDMVQNDQGIHFSSDRADLPNDSTNLCVRAAILLRDLTGCHTGVEMALTKRIPIGAGLGGGSSDAAAVLRGLTKLWSLDISADELQTISGTLVLFFRSDSLCHGQRGNAGVHRAPSAVFDSCCDSANPCLHGMGVFNDQTQSDSETTQSESAFFE
jgi:hypothetical protein